MTTTPPLLQLVKVGKSFGRFRALHEVDLDVAAGSVTCIVGPSGSGKSTLLRTVNMLEPIDEGAILFEGTMIGHRMRKNHRVPVAKSVARRQTLHFGMVFQNFNLFPNHTALDNVAIAPRLVRKLSKDAARATATRALEQVGLGDRTGHYPSELSGGQQQRVAIARALAMEPRLLLFDEPTSALDPELVGEVLGVMRELAATGSTMLVVTHELRFAADVADQVVMMDGGRIVEAGAPAEILADARTERARKFFASVTSH
ncbi:amino acid ABC transporter ATP-binding protein [Amycolatopsis pigmentata]|uniref:Amino acid ABC transporter ATP-binding protein n=1 Tax=Amycolatopsis pigmentata TaxID=450801 RepID=A0ABW5FZH1_9PSEU